MTPPTNGHLPVAPVEFTRCPKCQRMHETADAYVAAHPAFGARIGPSIARERVEAVLFGLAIIGQRPTGDLGLFLLRLHPAAHSVRFSNPLTLTTGLCSPRPWAHVSLSQRAEVRNAYAAALRDRLALSAPPVAIRCLKGGCVLCGLASVNRAAIEVARRGGVEAVSRSVWREVNTSPVARGSQGPQRIWAHACPSCSSAIEEACGIGWPARAIAVVAHVSRAVSPQKQSACGRCCPRTSRPCSPRGGRIPRHGPAPSRGRTCQGDRPPLSPSRGRV